MSIDQDLTTPGRLALRVSAPFKGINKEQPAWQIAEDEFQELLNFFVYTNDLYSRPEPKYTQLQPGQIGLRIRDLQGMIFQLQGPINGLQGTAQPGPILGILDGYTDGAERAFAVITDQYVFGYLNGNWVVLQGILNGDDQFVSTTSLLGRLMFSQGIDKIQVWDGSSTTFGELSPDAPAAKFLTTYADRVIAAYTVEVGTTFYQRVRWSRDGDPTDWTSFGSGFVDLLSGNDPITGVTVINDRLVVFFPQRIELGRRTFDALQPFAFDPYQKAAEGSAVGNVCPFSLASWGNICCFVSREDIYSFDSQILQRIGGKAQKAILADVRNGDPEKVYGRITDLSTAKDHLMYWLCCPNGAIWIYDFSTTCWLRVNFPGRQVNVIGRLSAGGGIRIIDLIGTIAEQNWVIGELSGGSSFDDILLGFKSAELGVLDYTIPTATLWRILSGEHVYVKEDWNKTLKRIRVKYADRGRGLATLRVTNELNQEVIVQRYLGTPEGGGKVKNCHFDFTMSGERITYELTGSFPISISELNHEVYFRGPATVGQNSQSRTL